MSSEGEGEGTTTTKKRGPKTRHHSLLPQTIRKGILWKLNPHTRQRAINPMGPWKRRWFALDEERFQMRYYNSSMHLKGTIDIRLTSSVEPLDGMVKGFYAFTIKSNVNPRVFTLGHSNRQERDTWVDHLRSIVDNMPPVNPRLVDLFRRFDKDKSFSLEFPEVKSLLAERKVQVTPHTMRLKFEEVDVDHNDSLDFSEFERLDMNLRLDEHASHLFDLWAEKAKFISVEKLLAFLHGSQREFGATRNDCIEIMDKHKPDDPSAPPHTMDMWGFTEWITSTFENGPTDKARSAAIVQEMDHPLSHYWIAGSHHSYLLSEHVKGQTSAESYVAILMRGARYIEIDVWDGSGGQPVVCHSSSLFHKLPFAGVVQKIREHAFRRTQMPLIVAINNHCSTAQQDVVAARLQEFFTDCMSPMFRTDVLPSPEALKNRVLLKMRMMWDQSMASSGSKQGSMIGKVKAKKTKLTLGAGTSAAPAGDPRTSVLAPVPDVSGESSGEESIGFAGRRAPKKHSPEETSRALSSLIHLEGIPFPGLVRGADGKRRLKSTDGRPVPCWRIFSLSNEKEQQLVDKGYLSTAQEYTADHLVRVYPRSDDFLYDPSSAWASGCQIATVNWHAPSMPLLLNEAKFQDNGSCGYILKPDWLIAGSVPPEDSAVKLTVKVISARQLPQLDREVIDPYVSVDIRGWPVDFQEQRTKAITNNGWDPKWGTELTFELAAPDVDIIVFSIWDQNSFAADRMVARSAISIPMLKLGVRALPLYSSSRLPLPGARLLCEFQIEAL